MGGSIERHICVFIEAGGGWLEKYLVSSDIFDRRKLKIEDTMAKTIRSKIPIPLP